MYTNRLDPGDHIQQRLFVEYSLGQSKGSAADAARRAGDDSSGTIQARHFSGDEVRPRCKALDTGEEEALASLPEH